MKQIIIKYTAEVPIENFDKFCKRAGIGKKYAVELIKENAIKAAEQEINYLVNETINQ
tara:strand:+ start:347 stop:520 length:174 start_codon:yes stop_codon:yes gene_type:complete